jgi:hypothetical protein
MCWIKVSCSKDHFEKVEGENRFEEIILNQFNF